jgi:hypothetical protein
MILFLKQNIRQYYSAIKLQKPQLGKNAEGINNHFNVMLIKDYKYI